MGKRMGGRVGINRNCFRRRLCQQWQREKRQNNQELQRAKSQTHGCLQGSREANMPSLHSVLYLALFVLLQEEEPLGRNIARNAPKAYPETERCPSLVMGYLRFRYAGPGIPY